MVSKAEVTYANLLPIAGISDWCIEICALAKRPINKIGRQMISFKVFILICVFDDSTNMKIINDKC
jgi:hypothetical protein